MRIGIDIMGGDFAPYEIVLGAISASQYLPTAVKLVLIGDESAAKAILQKLNFDANRFDYVHSTEVIEMGEHPTKAFSKKQNSSIAIGFRLLHNGEINGFASAGNTGAMLVGAMYTVKAIPGVIRPCIAAAIPRLDGKSTLILDVGLNVDVKPDVLYQFAILGSKYAEAVFNMSNPRIGLLNVGSEEEKGNSVAQSAHALMKSSSDFNFIGNVEGTDIFDYEKVDVIICDGFVGNVVLKEAEAFYSQIKKRNIHDSYFDMFNFENFGGTPILGINGTVIIGHGISNAAAIKSMLLHTYEVIHSNLTQKFKETFKQ
jgi:glycerol-3-phosphate acyltransferase PlsX